MSRTYRVGLIMPRGADALVLSSCVQMPSLPVLQQVEDECDLPVISAATATAD